jgi:YesN/AraC family two-component response regulator
MIDSKPIIGEFLRSSTIYLDLLFDYKVSVSLESWEQVKEAYIKLNGMYAPMSRMVVRARRYIQEHFAEVDLNLSRIDAVEISKNHLSWEFSKETGQSLSSYISQVRIEHAIPLLEQTTLMTYEIAETVGFKNVETFARVFKKITGKTPRDFS